MNAVNFIADIKDLLAAQRRYYAEDRQDIAAENLVALEIAGLAGGAASILFFFLAPVAIPTWKITPQYYLAPPLLFLTALFAGVYRRRPAVSPSVVEWAGALFYGLLLAVFTGISVFPYPNTPQIFISLCFMFMPTLLIMRPAVLLGVMAAGEGVYLYLAWRFKTPFGLEQDIFNTLAAMMFAIVITVLTNRLRCRTYAARLKLEQIGRTDALTGLLNKQAFEEGSAALLRTRNTSGRHALLVLDLDDFKNINDSYGHPFGDLVLAETGAVLRGVFRQDDLVGRIGGDEFAVLMREVGDTSILARKCTALRERLSAVTVDGVSLHPTCSIGTAVAPEDGAAYSELFRAADEALYRVKRTAKKAMDE